MKNSYYKGTGKFQAEYDRLEQLMPSYGNADTLAGELIRSAARLMHDFYNNGMGNNTSGAINFLNAHGVISSDNYRTIYDYTRGSLYKGSYEGDSFHVAIESVMEQTIEFILEHPSSETTPNTEDMFDFEDQMEDDIEDEYDEYDDEFENEYEFEEEY